MKDEFRIKKIIPPALSQPTNYDPLSVEGHQEVSKIHEEIGTEEKMYIQAEVELIPEIDENISLVRCISLVRLNCNREIFPLLGVFLLCHNAMINCPFVSQSTQM